MRPRPAGLRSALCRDSVRNGYALSRCAAPRCRNPTHRRPIRAQNGACATTAYPADCPKRAFELPIRRARRFILIERMLRGLAVREGGREGSTYVLAAKGRRTAFAEQSLKKEGGFNFDSQHPRLRIEVESAVRHYGCFFFPKTALNVVPVIIMQRQIEITEITT